MGEELTWSSSALALAGEAGAVKLGRPDSMAGFGSLKES